MSLAQWNSRNKGYSWSFFSETDYKPSKPRETKAVPPRWASQPPKPWAHADQRGVPTTHELNFDRYLTTQKHAQLRKKERAAQTYAEQWHVRLNRGHAATAPPTLRERLARQQQREKAALATANRALAKGPQAEDERLRRAAGVGRPRPPPRRRGDEAPTTKEYGALFVNSKLRRRQPADSLDLDGWDAGAAAFAAGEDGSMTSRVGGGGPSATSGSQTARVGGSANFAPAKARRQGLDRSTAAFKSLAVGNLGGSTITNMTGSWQRPQLIKWRREPLNDVAPKKDDDDEGDKARLRNPNMQYDRVSELHGFLSQKNIGELLELTNYNRRELYVIYVRFKALCALSPTPEGIDKNTFKTGVARMAVEDDKFVERVFQVRWVDGR